MKLNARTFTSVKNSQRACARGLKFPQLCISRMCESTFSAPGRAIELTSERMRRCDWPRELWREIEGSRVGAGVMAAIEGANAEDSQRE